MSAPGPGDRSTVGVTIMFTDLVGSTEFAGGLLRHLDESADARALEQHDGAGLWTFSDTA